MATYKYQQNLYDGAAAGYVKYNITPAIGTRVSIGEKVTISGQAYCRDKKIYGVGVNLEVGDVWEDPENFRGFEVAQKKVTIAKGSTGTFSLSFALTEEQMSELGDLSERAFTALIRFSLYDVSDLSGGEETNTVASQKVSLLKYREAPVIQSAEISDATGAESVFGGFVQGQSILKMTMQAETDPQDSKVTIASRILTLDGTKHLLSSDAQEVGTLAKSGVVDWTLKVTDSKGLSAETSGSISLIPYSPPVIESLTAFRYKEMISDDGSISYVAADDGEQVWFSLAGTVTPVSGKNAWTLTVEWDGKSSVVRSGEDGAEIILTNDRDVVSDAVSATERMEFTWTLKDYFTSVVMRAAVEKAGAYFNVEQDGVAVGMRSTGTPIDKKFEVAEDYDSHFYGDTHFHGEVKADKIYSTVKILRDKTAYTLTAEDMGKMLCFQMSEESGTVTVTIPADAGMTMFPLGAEFEIHKWNKAVTLKIVTEGASTGVLNIRTTSKSAVTSVSIAMPYGVIVFKRLSETKWYAAGDVQ